MLAYYSEDMSDTHKSPAPSRLLSTLLSCVNQNWIMILFDLYRISRQWFQHQSHEGMYKILDYDLSLTLMDPKGKTAVFKKRQQVKFLQDHIIAFQDYVWGDGEIFKDYKCSPGKVVDRYQEGDRWNVLISLRETKSAGDVSDFYIERTARNGFTKNKEWLQAEIRHATKRLKLSVIFPSKRYCQRAILSQRTRHQTKVLSQEHFTTLPDGRQVVTWETKKIKQFEIFTLQWEW